MDYKDMSSCFDVFPDKKTILLIRDGRDCLLSYFHWLRYFADYQGDFNQFLSDTKYQTPHQAFAQYYADWLEARQGNIHLVRFEDVRANPCAEIKNLLKFIGCERDNEQIDLAINESSYQKMREHENTVSGNSEARIMRKGKVGGWKEEMTDAQLLTLGPAFWKVMNENGYD
jgi:hypothetical protein